MTRFLIVAVALLVIAGSMTACGRKGDPEFPEGSSYPRDYPSK
ncbi:MAG: lipoprotein [Magnetovibrio sp.]|nr:lipoprotein [Magnetovibrio sp.]